MIYYFFSTPGTWREVLRKGVTPVIEPRPEAAKCKELQEIRSRAEDVERQLLHREDREDREDTEEAERSEQGSDERILLPSVSEEEVRTEAGGEAV